MTTRIIPRSKDYPGLFAVKLDATREIVAVGEGAEEVVLAEVERREARHGRP